MSNNNFCRDEWTRQCVAIVDEAVRTVRKRGVKTTKAFEVVAGYLGLSPCQVHAIIYRGRANFTAEECLTLKQRWMEGLDTEFKILEKDSRAVLLRASQLELEIKDGWLPDGWDRSENGQSSSTYRSVTGAGRARSARSGAGTAASSRCAAASVSGSRRPAAPPADRGK